jgi:regulator of protease activity HflC (stomatin/prohibitin superfamily)
VLHLTRWIPLGVDVRYLFKFQCPLKSYRITGASAEVEEISRRRHFASGRDNVSVKVNAVVYFRVVDPAKAIIQVANPFEATSQLAQTTLRSVLGQHELDEMLSQREKLNADVQRILDDSTDIWGIKVSHVEIKHVDLDESMIRAMAQQAEAERSRRAKVIHADGERQAAAALVEAAKTLGGDPRAIQLRYLQTLSGLASSGTQTIVFPLPMDLITPLLNGKTGSSG